MGYKRGKPLRLPLKFDEALAALVQVKPAEKQPPKRPSTKKGAGTNK